MTVKVADQLDDKELLLLYKLNGSLGVRNEKPKGETRNRLGEHQS